MKIEIKTMEHHGTKADGSEMTEAEFCCGCWHVALDEDAPLRPYVKCNECGEIRTAVFPGVSSDAF